MQRLYTVFQRLDRSGEGLSKDSESVSKSGFHSDQHASIQPAVTQHVDLKQYAIALPSYNQPALYRRS
ncbi:MAG: hypothetical protein ACK2T5_07125, partial [Anaerolineales bacterium]